MDEIEDLSKMKVADLKKYLKTRGLSVTGNKTELVERLQEARDQSPLNPSGDGADDDDFDEEEILGQADDDLDKLTQEEEAAALAGHLREKEESLLMEAADDSPVEKKRISLKRSEPCLSSATEKTAEAENATDEGEEKQTEETETDETAEPKRKIIKITAPVSDNALENRAKKFGVSSPTKPSSDSEQGRKDTRAARFGSSASDDKKKPSKLSSETGGTDLEKLKKRAERFGEVTAKALSKLEDTEKIKKRQNRFGSTDSAKSSDGTETTTNNTSTTAKEARAARFGSDTNGSTNTSSTVTSSPITSSPITSSSTSTKTLITAPSSDTDDPKKKRTQRFASAAV